MSQENPLLSQFTFQNSGFSKAPEKAQKVNNITFLKIKTGDGYSYVLLNLIL